MAAQNSKVKPGRRKLNKNMVDEDKDLEFDMMRLDSTDSCVDLPTRSLYDWKTDRRFKGDETRKSLLHRMVIISKIAHQDFEEIGKHYDKKFKDAQNDQQGDGVTGLLLLYPRHCVHVVESSLEVLVDLVRCLKADSENGGGPTEMSKILSISHDIPHRLYNQWSIRILNIEAARLEEYDPSEAPDKLIIDILTQLLKLGAYISRQPKVSLKNAMDSLHDKVPEFLPQQDVVGYLLDHEEQCVYSPDDYLNQYDLPYDVVLANDLVWPMPTRLFPYN